MSLVHEINNIDYQEANEKLYQEKYIKELLDYYDESPRKQATRRKLLKQLSDYIVINKNYRATMSDISHELKIERKSIYRYFPTIDDIIIDLAYLTVTTNNSRYLIKAKEINNLTTLSNQEKFKLTLREVAKIMIINRTYLEYLGFFDEYFNALPSKNGARERYRSLITGFKTRNHYLREIIYRLDADNELQEHSDVNEFVELV